MLNMIPWKVFLRYASRKHGFIDPILLLNQFNRFSRPSELVAPTELLRAGATLHARGLLNSQAIQHNLDWLWPYWVEEQFNPGSTSFIPRAFSITHINLTHRNWTAVGVPGFHGMPVVDPRGLVMPFRDGWSIDAWLITDDGKDLFPSRTADAVQELDMSTVPTVRTVCRNAGLSLTSSTDVTRPSQSYESRTVVEAESDSPGWLVISLRPYNPEGVSLIHQIETLGDLEGWVVNDEKLVRFGRPADRMSYSGYHDGDVYRKLRDATAFHNDERLVKDVVGLATGAALFRVHAGKRITEEVTVPLKSEDSKKQAKMGNKPAAAVRNPEDAWKEARSGAAKLESGDATMNRLYQSALETTILHSPRDALAGPFTYKRFWFRDAVLIANAMAGCGLVDRARMVIEQFFDRQTLMGYFESQEGEWDSNGQVLWVLHRLTHLSGEAPPAHWKEYIVKAVKWIQNKRETHAGEKPHAGLLPAGFSAEHLGPNDHYYWDDFWAIAGLRGAEYLLKEMGDDESAELASQTAEEMMAAVDVSLDYVEERLGRPLMPASPYRRMDSGAIGSIVAGYPLQLTIPDTPRMNNTIEYLMDSCIVEGGFYHDISHSGINPYLTLHLAQVLLRKNDYARALQLFRAIGDLASPTGQWPEAIHPKLRTGCMGDGQHVWAAAEWLLMVKNCFVREEETTGKLVLGSGIDSQWFGDRDRISFGPVCTKFGSIILEVVREEDSRIIRWTPRWHAEEPNLEIRLPGAEPRTATDGAREIRVKTSGESGNGHLDAE